MGRGETQNTLKTYFSFQLLRRTVKFENIQILFMHYFAESAGLVFSLIALGVQLFKYIKLCSLDLKKANRVCAISTQGIPHHYILRYIYTIYHIYKHHNTINFVVVVVVVVVPPTINHQYCYQKVRSVCVFVLYEGM